MQPAGSAKHLGKAKGVGMEGAHNAVERGGNLLLCATQHLTPEKNIRRTGNGQSIILPHCRNYCAPTSQFKPSDGKAPGPFFPSLGKARRSPQRSYFFTIE